MLRRLFLVTDIMCAEELLVALLGKAPLKVQVQKYAAAGEKEPFAAKWTAPVQAELKVSVLSNEMISDSENLMMASGQIVHIALASTPLGSKKAYTGSMELRGAYADVLFDTELKVGVIIEAVDYRRVTPKKVAGCPELDLLIGDDELVDDAELKAMGLPDELAKSKALLLELAKRYRN